MKNYLQHYLTLFIFVFVLLIPPFDRKLHILPVVESTEKRDLSPRPDYSVAVPIPEKIRSFEAFWNDNFGGRNLLISLRAKIWVKLFRESPVSSVVIGKDDLLFYKSEAKDDGPGINDAQGLVVMDQKQIDGIVASLTDLNKRLKDRGITLVITVAPNKSTIYKESLPYYIRDFSSPSRLDQLIPHLPQDLTFVDLRTALIAGKTLYPTYQKADSHWNDYGAFLSAQTIMSSLPAKYHPKLLTMDDYVVGTRITSGEGDLASMMAARGINSDMQIDFKLKSGPVITNEPIKYFKGKYLGRVWQQQGKNLPRLFLTGDSFRTALEPFLAHYFSQTHSIVSSPVNFLQDDLLNFIKPDIIIWEVCERYIEKLQVE